MTRAQAVWIHGVTGRMGRLVRQMLANYSELDFCGGSGRHFFDQDDTQLDKVNEQAFAEKLRSTDLVIDFSSPAGTDLLLKAVSRVASDNRPAVLIATTGLSDAQKASWEQLKDTRILVAPNTSLGIMVLAQVTKQLAQYLPAKNFDLEITETHHRHKLDAPSGTALFLASSAEQGNSKLQTNLHRSGKRQSMEVGVHAVRGGNVFGEHAVRFLGDQEELCLSHRAFSRDLFAVGALTLGQWLLDQENGVYDLFDVDLT